MTAPQRKGRMLQISVQIPPDVKDAIEAAAHLEGISIAAYLRRLAIRSVAAMKAKAPEKEHAA